MKLSVLLSLRVVASSSIPRRLFSSSAFKTGTFWRKRHELDSPTWVVLHHTTAITFPYGACNVGGKDKWTPYRAYLLSDLRTSPPLKRSQPPQTGHRRC
ncbi:hypothetical protein AVEN_5697-1 [Araneus ventricosus]|uniref:Uncharacterized protein n=1 Tax=Araneus ventricosus TaxID=182803 RepID=A0A4Y2DVT0_ARAVE|nr:hypothetical protein AVEN_5697-1 [Araneus ventricosus]